MESSQKCSSPLESSLVSFRDEKKTTPIQTPRQKNKQMYGSFKNKLKDLLPAIFKKDPDRGNFIFDIFCDIIRINNLIDTFDDIPSLEFILTEQRIKWALENFFSIRQIISPDYSAAKCLKNYMNPYKSQFKELAPIGSGGFGRVVKVQHLLDRAEYAVKKIIIKARREKEIIKCLDEVKILAQLNHLNIVSYKQAWIEALEETQIPESSRGTPGSADSDYVSGVDSQFFHINSDRQNKSCRDPAIHSVDDSVLEISVDENEPVIVLYIQMNLCQRNLREWMDERKTSSSLAVIEDIAVQILRGLEFIHEKNFTHHDIKPQNIFVTVVSEKNHVQIGDFGLACCKNDKFEDRNHSHAIGTLVYVAPEQKDKGCHQKSDIYSFGIVLFELMNLMRSEMELVNQILDLKKKKFPTSTLKTLYPGWVEIMEKAIQEDLTQRSSAKEILQQVELNKDLKILKLEQELEQKLIKYEDDKAIISIQLQNIDEALALARAKLLELSIGKSD